PGLLLNGGIGYVVGWLIVLIGLASAPHDYWTFFSSNADFTGGGVTGTGVLDIILLLLLRPFYFAVAVFGYQLPNIFAVVLGFFGFFTAKGRGHTKYTPEQDRRAIRKSTWFLAAYLWIAATTILGFNLGSALYPFISIPLPVVGSHISVWLIAFVFANSAYYPPPAVGFPWNGFAVYAVFFVGISALVAGRILIAVRRRLYKWAEKSAGGLLNPP